MCVGVGIERADRLRQGKGGSGFGRVRVNWYNQYFGVEGERSKALRYSDLMYLKIKPLLHTHLIYFVYGFQ